MKKFLLFCLIFSFISCEKESLRTSGTSINNNSGYNNDGGLCDGYCDVDEDINIADKVINKDGEVWLWGGENEDWHFNVTNLDLDLKGFKFGLGREFFEALIEPQYKDISTFNSDFFKENDKFILVEGESEKKAYSYDLMVRHEVINDVIEGEPIMVGYCVLADFPAVYSRKYCDQTFTFAVSGYTYSQDGIWEGKDGFILWDRDSESLWWPLIGKAVSGGMKDFLFSDEIGSLNWRVETWDNLQEMEGVSILKYNQSMDPPEDFPRIDVSAI